MSDDIAALSATLGDRYLIERELGRGGMGAVYLARDRRLDRPVALKVLPREYAAVPELRERFLRETRTAAGFSHPNIVPVFAVEEQEGLLAFAMGFVEGESLATRVARAGPLSSRDIVRMLQDVGYALAYAHGRGVVHRDIKPDNIMIERATGRALVMDFGIARAITPVVDKPGLTRVGEVVGTPEYMSPEQAAGEAVDGRADLYSLGLVAWFAATGETAMTGESTQRILVRQLTEPVAPLATQRPNLPARLCAVVDQCCAKEAADRFANAEALVEALEAAQLSAPEVPVAIRLLAPQLETGVSRMALAAVFLTLGLPRLIRAGAANVFSIGLIIAATGWVALVTSVQELRRLYRSGYTPEEVQRLLGSVQAERDEARAARRTDTALVRRRRLRLILVTAILLSQLVTLYLLLKGKLREGDATLITRRDSVTFFAALISIALTGSVILSSPFRPSLGERVFRLALLGKFGRRVLRAAGWRLGAATVASSAVATPRTVTQTATNGPSIQALAGDLTRLQQRVAALEQRRDA